MKIICEVCKKEIKNGEQVAVFFECGTMVYTHVMGDNIDCDYRYMMDKMTPNYMLKEEIE